MKRIVKLIFFFSFTLFSVFAQQISRTIEVKGTGTYNAMPDIGVLTIEVVSIDPVFSNSVKELYTKTEQLTAQLQMVGFKKEDIKTTDFSVGKNMVWENNANVDKGYIAKQNISLEFPNTKEKIGAIINSFMNSENEIRFSFYFTLSDEKEAVVKSELLKRAVSDARTRADIIAAAAKQKIGSIKNISYGIVQEQGPFRKSTYSISEMAVSAQRASGFDVKEMKFTDDITIVWELK